MEPQLVKTAFEGTKQKDLNQWNKIEINQTLLAKRRKAQLIQNKQPDRSNNVIPFPSRDPCEKGYMDIGQKTVRAKQTLR